MKKWYGLAKSFIKTDCWNWFGVRVRRPIMIHKLKGKCYSGKEEQNTFLEQGENKHKNLYQWSCNLISSLRADYNVQWLGEAVVKIDQQLQPWKLVNLQKHSPHTNIENISLLYATKNDERNRWQIVWKAPLRQHIANSETKWFVLQFRVKALFWQWRRKGD